MKMASYLASGPSLLLRIGWPVLLTLIAAIRCQDDFYFRKWPQSPPGAVRSGQSVHLECRVSAEERISLSWTLDGELLFNSSRRYQDPTSGGLVIRRVDHRLDSGAFACTATNVSSGFSIASQPARLAILWIGNATLIKAQMMSGSIAENPSGVSYVPFGSDLVLECQADGSAELLYDWYHNGRKIPKNKNKRLVLSSATPTEAGTYTCQARNGAGHSKFNRPFVLSVNPSSKASSRLVRFTGELIAAPETSVKLECAYSPPAPVQWLYRGSVINSSPEYKLENDGHLIINSVEDNSEGWYVCRKPAGPGEAVEEYATHLRLAFLNDFAKAPIDPPAPLSNGRHYFAEYSTAELTCIAPDGVPQPVVWWEGPQGHTLTVPAHAIESILILTRVLGEDAGQYTCWAMNSVRKVSTKTTVVVTTPPVIQQHPMSASVNEEEEASMSCTFDGVPAPGTSVKWLLDDKPVPEHFKTEMGTLNATLTFQSALKKHAGSYACQIETIGQHPVVSHTATLHVRDKLRFTILPVTKTLELGTARKVLCKAQGNPAPVVRWMKETEPMMNWAEHVEDVNGTLFFNGVRQEDEGKYTCVATNSQGLISATVYINVTMSPQFVSLPENVTFTKLGQKLELNCQAEGHPVPTIQWDKDSVMDGFPAERFTVYPNGTLAIENVQQEDEGYYGCTAGNAGGFKRAEFRLIVRTWESEIEGESIIKTIIITLGAALAYILLSVSLLIWCRMKRRQRKLQSSNGVDNDQPDAQTALLTKDGQAEAGLHPPITDKLNVPASTITRGPQLGRGRFGDILEGVVAGLVTPDASTRVLMRSLATRDEELMIEFRRQADVFHRIKHPNVAAVLGCCRETADAQLLLMEYHQLCNLKTHLLTSSQPWSLAQIQSATIQIAKGMNAIAQARFVHRDLGTRNVLVGYQGKEVTVKVGSFGMDKHPFSNDYFVYKHQLIPLRWLPHEAVFDDEYSTKSDVWMFAVTVWELHNAAKTPMADLMNEALLADLNDRTLKWDASFCKSNALASCLAKCWSHDPMARPSFDELVQTAESVVVSGYTNGDLKNR